MSVQTGNVTQSIKTGVPSKTVGTKERESGRPDKKPSPGKEDPGEGREESINPLTTDLILHLNEA